MVRVFMKATVPAERGNELIRTGKLPEMIGKAVEMTKPECIYFTEQDGCRCAVGIFHLHSSSDLPKIAEPWFLAFDGKVTFTPAMTAEDLMAAGPHIEASVKAFS